MDILTVNTGSSSIRYDLFRNRKRVSRGKIERVCTKKSFVLENKRVEKVTANTFAQAAKVITDRITQPDIVSYRIVYGKGLNEPILISQAVMDKIKQGNNIAPLHNPPALEVIKVLKKSFPKSKHVAVFDTAIHQTIPEKRKRFAIPSKYFKSGIKKVGFHGLAIEFVINFLKKEGLNNKKVIAIHLGNGSSATAIKNNKVVDTSMGFTPLDGLIMGSRSGSLDPGVVLELVKKEGIKKTENILWNESGLKALGDHSDVRDLRTNEKGRDAIDVLIDSVIQKIGSYVFMLKGIDILCFTGGISENEPGTMKKLFNRLDVLNIKFNGKNNGEVTVKNSKVKVFILKSDEAFILMKRAAGF